MNDKGMAIPIDKNNPSIVKDDSKCIFCGHCMKVCKDEITVARMYEIDKTKKPICINCGQCANICPTEAITERFDYLKVKSLLKSKIKIMTFSIAPAVRVAIGEEFNDSPGINLSKKIVTALKKLGANYVFDITFGADLTIMEEAQELVNRINNKGKLPMFTSCCPSWVKYAEIFYPEILSNLSTCKSPIAMQGSIINNYFLKKVNLKRKDVVNVVVAPCTAKKMEIKKYNDIDYILTTRELAMLLKEENIDLCKLEDSEYDSPLGEYSSAGLIFGSSGGVCEAAIRTCYFLMTGKNLKKEDLVFNDLRGMNGVKESTVNIGNKEIKVAVANGMANAKKILDKMKTGELEYDFIEVMNCMGGCIAGGGQPKITLMNMKETKISRMNGLYSEDEKSTLRLAHENPMIKEIYKEFLNVPNSDIARNLLHTTYEDKSYLLGGEK